MEKAILLRVSEEMGMVEIIDFEKDGLDFYYEKLGCDTIDIVSAYGLSGTELEGKGICLVVDDEALLKEKPVLNPAGSLLYGAAKHGQPLCGNVMVCKDHYTDEGTETVGFTDEEVIAVMKTITELMERHFVRK